MNTRLLGLTGGIASGKSTVSQFLQDKGAALLCADSIYHQLISPVNGKPSELAKQIDKCFPGILLEDGALNRPELGTRVFGKEIELQKLGAITHPAVAQEVQRQVVELSAQGQELVFYDVPLLFERNLQELFEGVLVVWVPAALQLERLILRDGLSTEEAQKRIASQLPIEHKKQQATWLIDNSGSIEATREQVESFWNGL